MDLFMELRRNTKWKDWREGGVWLLYSLIGGLLPVWAGMIMFKLFKQKFTLATFSDNGEFALYSASYLTGIFYILFKDFKDLKNRKFPSIAIISLFVITLLLATSFMFASICSINAIGNSGIPQILNILDKEFLRNFCLLCFILTLIMSFFVVVADNMRVTPDLKKMYDDQYDELDKQFDKL